MKSLKLFLTLLITGPLLMAQQSPAVFLAPNEDDNNFGVTDPEITRTGAAGCEIDNASLFIMVWDGEKSGFGWDYDHGILTGYQEFMMGDELISHPNVVLYHNDYNNQTLAYIVYELDEVIWYEIWEYDMGTNQWNIYDGPEEIGDGIQPNVDRTPEEDLAIVWGDPNEDHIYGATGNIVGDFYSNGVVFTCGLGHDVANPDVAINWKNNEPHILVVYRSIDYATSQENAAVLHYSYDEFNNAGANGVGVLPFGEPGSFGPPRIAAPHYHPNDTLACQVVQVEHTNSGEYIVYGGNSNVSGGLFSTSVLNAHEYYSQLDGNTYNPQEHETMGPVVSFYEDIHVAWAYKAPETGNFVIVYRRLDEETGEVRKTHPYGYDPNEPDYSYSLVNGVDYSWEAGDQYLPCIASRYSHENDKIIGWFNADQWDDPRPEYKITHTNEIFFDLSVEADVGLVYPNPVFDQLNYDLTDEKASVITLYAYDGRKMLSHHVSNKSGSIDVSNLPAGMYITVIKLPNRIIRKKIVKI